jgi:O-antigen ligase
LVAAMLGVLLFQAGLGMVQAAAGGSLDSYLIPSERKFFESIQLTSGTTQFWSPGTRVFATMGRYDQLGTFLCFFMLLALGLYYVYRGERAGQRYGAMVLAGVPALFLTMSRASWFGFIGGLLFIGAWVKKDVRVRLSFMAAIAAALLYLGWSGLTVRYLTDYAGQTPVERFFEAFSFERWRGEYYGLGRLYWMVQTPTVVVRSSPILGVGPGQYGGGAVAALGNTAVYDRLNLPFGVYGTDGYIDNNWFAIWGETGTLGLFFYAWMVLALWLIGWRTFQKSRDKFLRGLALGYCGAVMAVTFQAFLATYLEVRTLALYLWLLGAAIYCWGRRDKIYD